MLQLSATYAITGIPVPQGKPIPARKDIAAWANDPANARQFSLFIRAESAFQSVEVTEKLSYFQIAGKSPAAKQDLKFI